MFTTFIKIGQRFAAEMKIKFREAAKVIRKKRPDLFEAGGGDISGFATVSEALEAKPSPAAATETSTGREIDQATMALLERADRRAEEEGVNGGLALKMCILDDEFDKTGVRWPLSVLDRPGKARHIGAKPIGHSEGGPMGMSTETNLRDDARALAAEKGIKFSEAVRQIRKGQ